MSRTPSVRWSIVLALFVASGLRAQVSSAAGVGALVQRDGSGLWQSATRFDPAVRFDNAWGQLGGEATLGSGSRGTRFEQGNLGFTLETPAWHGFRISNSGAWERLTVLPGFANQRGTIESALSYGRAGTGGWIGMASEQSFASSGYAGNALLRAGLWHRLANFTVFVSTANHRALERTMYQVLSEHVDTIVATVLDTESVDRGASPPRYADTIYHHDSVYTSRARTRVRRWGDLETGLSGSFGRLAIDSRFGFQRDGRDSLGTNPAVVLWGQAAATLALAPHLSVVAAFGTQPARAWTGNVTSRFASLGVRIAPAMLARPAAPPHLQPAASRFAIRAADSGMYVVTIQAPSARAVELSGDFNGWHPIAMRQTRPDVWETTLSITPGTYRVNMRVNGATWIAPPGLSATADEFNGTVGLLVVR